MCSSGKLLEADAGFITEGEDETVTGVTSVSVGVPWQNHTNGYVAKSNGIQRTALH